MTIGHLFLLGSILPTTLSPDCYIGVWASHVKI
jgi:hypothetical protein